MPELRLADIQAGLGLSTSRFGKLRRAVREEVEREGLATKTLATNSMRLSLQELVGRMIAKFDRILPADNDDFNKEAILKLVHIEKANVARHVETKRKANQDIITHSNANPPEPIPSRVVQASPPPTLTPMTSSKRDLKRHGQKPLQNRSVAALNPPSLERCSQKSPEPDPRFSIEVSVSQAQRPVENRIAEPFVIVRAEATLNDPTVLSLNCFLTDKTAPAVVGDKLLQACYHTLCNVLREEGFLGTEAEEKLWGWVASGPFSGWWRIRSSYSLRSCLTAQRSITPDGHYEYVVNHGEKPSRSLGERLPLKRSVECALEPESSAKKLRRSDPISLDPPQQLKRKSVNSSASEVAPPVPNPSKSTQAYWHATG